MAMEKKIALSLANVLLLAAGMKNVTLFTKSADVALADHAAISKEDLNATTLLAHACVTSTATATLPPM